MTSRTCKRSHGLWRVFAYALLLSAAVLLFCSKSSPAYPLNDWSDANIYFSVGKGMVNGQVVYRDLYDHKGPLLYALHALCALVSPMSFLGVYVLECLLAAAFLTCAYRLLCLYGAERAALYALPVIALVVYSSVSFEQGDSAEELCLPLLLYSLYQALRYFKQPAGTPVRASQVVLCGVLFGCVLWIKFTLCGLYAGLLLTLFLSQLWCGKPKQVFACIGWFALGFLLSTLPWLLYFGINGALLPWLKTYLYDNLFLYSEGEEAAGLLARMKDAVEAALSWFVSNPGYTLLCALGVGYLACGRGKARTERICIVLAAVFAAIGAFIGGKAYPYYGLVLAVLAPLGMVPICLLVKRILPTQKVTWAALLTLVTALCIGLCYPLSPNVKTSFLKPKQSLMQYQFAAELSRYESPTLLNYGFMDAGFYTASGIVPSVKYFHQTNVPLQEMLDEQIRYIDEGICDFVVTRGKQPGSIDNLYEQVLTADSPDGFWYDHVYLYKLKTLKAAE